VVQVNWELVIMTNKKYLYWLVAIVLIVTITFFVATNISRRGKIKVDLIVAPSKAEVLIDGKYVKSKTVYLKPGEHTFVVSFENFESTKVVQDVSVNPEVLLAAVPKTDSAREYLLKNPEENSILEKIGGIYQENANKKTAESYPFLSELPIEQRYFAIYNGAPLRSKVKNGDFAAAMYVKADSAYGRSLAVNSMRNELNIDPTVIEVYFQDAPPAFWEKGE